MKKVQIAKEETGNNAGRRSVSNFLARLYKNRKLRTLNKQEEARLTALEDCLEELTAMQSVVALRLKRVLLKHEYLHYREEYNGICEQNRELKDKPDEIKEYEKMLKLASFHYIKGDAYSVKGKHTAARKSLSIANVHFEKLYEYLQEITANDPSILQYFDRTVTFDAANAPSLTPEDAPRAVTSKSQHNQNKSNFTTLDECKIAAIEKAILNLKYDADDEQKNDQQLAKRNKLNEYLYNDEDEY